MTGSLWLRPNYANACTWWVLVNWISRHVYYCYWRLFRCGPDTHFAYIFHKYDCISNIKDPILIDDLTRTELPSPVHSVIIFAQNLLIKISCRRLLFLLLISTMRRRWLAKLTPIHLDQLQMRQKHQRRVIGAFFRPTKAAIVMVMFLSSISCGVLFYNYNEALMPGTAATASTKSRSPEAVILSSTANRNSSSSSDIRPLRQPDQKKNTPTTTLHNKNNTNVVRELCSSSFEKCSIQQKPRACQKPEFDDKLKQISVSIMLARFCVHHNHLRWPQK